MWLHKFRTKFVSHTNTNVEILHLSSIANPIVVFLDYKRYVLRKYINLVFFSLVEVIVYLILLEDYDFELDASTMCEAISSVEIFGQNLFNHLDDSSDMLSHIYLQTFDFTMYKTFMDGKRVYAEEILIVEEVSVVFDITRMNIVLKHYTIRSLYVLSLYKNIYKIKIIYLLYLEYKRLKVRTTIDQNRKRWLKWYVSIPSVRCNRIWKRFIPQNEEMTWKIRTIKLFFSKQETISK